MISSVVPISSCISLALAAIPSPPGILVISSVTVSTDLLRFSLSSRTSVVTRGAASHTVATPAAVASTSTRVNAQRCFSRVQRVTALDAVRKTTASSIPAKASNKTCAACHKVRSKARNKLPINNTVATRATKRRDSGAGSSG